MVEAILAEYDLMSPSFLIFELTQSVIIADTEKMFNKLWQLKSMGIKQQCRCDAAFDHCVKQWSRQEKRNNLLQVFGDHSTQQTQIFGIYFNQQLNVAEIVDFFV